jgi:hypothetical protein
LAAVEVLVLLVVQVVVAQEALVQLAAAAVQVLLQQVVMLVQLEELAVQVVVVLVEDMALVVLAAFLFIIKINFITQTTKGSN